MPETKSERKEGAPRGRNRATAAERLALKQLIPRISNFVEQTLPELKRDSRLLPARGVYHMMYRGSLVTGKEPWIKQLDPAFEYEEKDGDYPGWRLMSDQTALALVEIVKKLIDKSPELLRLVQTCKERGFEFDVVKDEFRDEIILPMDSIPIQEMHITPKIGRMFW